MKPRIRYVDGVWTYVGPELIPDPIQRIVYLGVLLMQADERQLRESQHVLGVKQLLEYSQYTCALLDSVLSILTKGAIDGVFETYFQRLEKIAAVESERVRTEFLSTLTAERAAQKREKRLRKAAKAGEAS